MPNAQGRFLVSNPMTVPSKVAHDALAAAFPEYKFPEGKDEPSKVVIDNSKVGVPCQWFCASVDFLTDAPSDVSGGCSIQPVDCSQAVRPRLQAAHGALHLCLLGC